MSDMFELKAIEMIAQNLKAAVDSGKDTVAREQCRRLNILPVWILQCRFGNRTFHGSPVGRFL